MESTKSTVIGVFSDVRDARRAVEELRLEGLGSYVRLIENDQPEDLNLEQATHPDPYRRGGISGFFARLFGFDEDPLKNQGNWKMDDESERYFSDAYHRRHSLVIVSRCGEGQICRSILERCGALVEERGNQIFAKEMQRTLSLQEEHEESYEEAFERHEGDDIRLPYRASHSSDYRQQKSEHPVL